MRNQLIRTALLLLSAAIVGTGFTHSAEAAVLFPKKSKSYTVWMARAFDECIPSGLTVVGLGLPSTGCLSANTVTDNTTAASYAKVRLTHKGKIKVVGRGFSFGDTVRVRLHLRVTKEHISTLHPPNAAARVTFADATIDCPPAPGAFAVRPNGSIITSTNLSSCFGVNSSLAGGTTYPTNIEIMGASVIHAVSGKELLRSGIVR